MNQSGGFLPVFLYLYDAVSDIHLLYLLAMGDGIELHLSLLDEIFQHIRYFPYRVGIEVVDRLVEEKNRGVDI